MKGLKQKLALLFPVINRLPRVNQIKLGGASLHLGRDSLLWFSQIKCVGRGNSIEIESGALLRNCRICVSGNSNSVRIGANAYLRNVEIWIEDDGNSVSVGSNANLCGKTHLACTEGTSLEIGEDCLFSSEIVFRTGDSHSIIDKGTSRRINNASSVRIGKHVWIGYHVLVNKGVCIADGCVIGTGSVVTKSVDESNCILAGVPAKIVKRGIEWDKRRI